MKLRYVKQVSLALRAALAFVGIKKKKVVEPCLKGKEKEYIDLAWFCALIAWIAALI